MKQTILIGFSTTGKTLLSNKIVNNFPNLVRFDTDEEISINYGGSIADIYYAFNNRNECLNEIERLERNILNVLQTLPENLVIAAGPGIPLRPEFETYIKTKKPHVILLERPPEDIYDSLKLRRDEMRKNEKHLNRNDFGIWDLGIMVKQENDDLIELDKDEAIEKIRKALKEREYYYNRYKTKKIDITPENSFPNELLEIFAT